MSINVSLPPELEARIRQRVESGMYGSASSEVIREALRLFEAYEQVKTVKLDSLRQGIAKGLNDPRLSIRDPAQCCRHSRSYLH